MNQRNHYMHVLANAYGHSDQEVYEARQWAHAEIERLRREIKQKTAELHAKSALECAANHGHSH